MSEDSEQYVRVIMRVAVLARAFGMRGEDEIELLTGCRIERDKEQPDGKAAIRLVLKEGYVPTEEDIQTLFPGAASIEYVGCERPPLMRSRIAPRVEIAIVSSQDSEFVIPYELHVVCTRVGWEVREERGGASGKKLIVLVPQRFGCTFDAPSRSAIEACFVVMGLSIATHYRNCGSMEDSFS